MVICTFGMIVFLYESFSTDRLSVGFKERVSWLPLLPTPTTFFHKHRLFSRVPLLPTFFPFFISIVSLSSSSLS